MTLIVFDILEYLLMEYLIYKIVIHYNKIFK